VSLVVPSSVFIPTPSKDLRVIPNQEVDQRFFIFSARPLNKDCSSKIPFWLLERLAIDTQKEALRNSQMLFKKASSIKIVLSAANDQKHLTKWLPIQEYQLLSPALSQFFTTLVRSAKFWWMSTRFLCFSLSPSLMFQQFISCSETFKTDLTKRYLLLSESICSSFWIQVVLSKCPY